LYRDDFSARLMAPLVALSTALADGVNSGPLEARMTNAPDFTAAGFAKLIFMGTSF
jgi:hypothetical protein